MYCFWFAGRGRCRKFKYNADGGTERSGDEARRAGGVPTDRARAARSSAAVLRPDVQFPRGLLPTEVCCCLALWR